MTPAMFNSTSTHVLFDIVAETAGGVKMNLFCV